MIRVGAVIRVIVQNSDHVHESARAPARAPEDSPLDPMVDAPARGKCIRSVIDLRRPQAPLSLRITTSCIMSYHFKVKIPDVSHVTLVGFEVPNALANVCPSKRPRPPDALCALRTSHTGIPPIQDYLSLALSLS
jgi:hypothetical protein